MGGHKAGAAAVVLRSFPRFSKQSFPPSVAVGARVEFGEHLSRQCIELADVFANAGGITLSCTTERAALPQSTASELALIALGLIASASSSFADRRNGRIGVTFRVHAAELELTVEHSGSGTPAACRRAQEAATLEQKLVAGLGGRIECPRMIGGVRMVVTVPRT